MTTALTIPNIGRFKKGQFSKENHPKWKGGKPLCIQCGERTKDYQSKICKKCYLKKLKQGINKGLRWTEDQRRRQSLNRVGKFIGENNPNFRGYFYCVDCGIKIDRRIERQRRCKKCSRVKFGKEHSGEKHPNWRGGISKEPYSQEWTEILKQKIRERDNYRCKYCKMTEEEHLIVVGRVLTVHHIDYDKKNCMENNLIAACSGCNARFNFNREYWKDLLCQLR